jgi:hypothetical protein
MRFRTPASIAVKLSASLALLLCGPFAGQAAADAGAATTTAPAASTATPAVASAAAPTSSTTTSSTPGSTTTTPPPPKPAVKGSATLVLDNVFAVHRQAVTVPRRTIRVIGAVRPFVPGQVVRVKAFLGRHRLKSKLLSVKPSRSHAFGRFTMAVQASRAGRVSFVVTHQRNRSMLGFEVRRSLTALSPHAGFGSRGPFVALIQQRLAALHFFLFQTGVYDQHTGLAVDAYHRLLRRGHAQTLDRGTVGLLLNGVGAFKVRFPKQGRHAEGNLGVQVLALIDGSKVQTLYPISSGKPSTPTVLGSFRVYERVPGYLPDGMYFSDFFFRGYAIHGFNPSPDFPASHGCMRLPISDAISAFNWLTIGDWVDVYY